MLDVIILFIVAAFIISRLLKVLGNIDDDTLKNIKNKRNTYCDSSVNASCKNHRVVMPKNDVQPQLKIIDADMISATEATLDGELRSVIREMREKEASFDADRFLRGATKAFVAITNAFSEGNVDTLKGLLKNDVYKLFCSEINERQRLGLTQNRRIIDVLGIDIINASISSKTNIASICVKIKSDQVYTITNKDGKVIEGEEDGIHHMIDKWTFCKRLDNTTTMWMLSKTE